MTEKLIFLAVFSFIMMCTDLLFALPIAWLPGELLSRLCDETDATAGGQPCANQSLAGITLSSYSVGTLVATVVAPSMLRAAPPLDIFRRNNFLLTLATLAGALTSYIPRQNGLTFMVLFCAIRVVQGFIQGKGEIILQSLLYRMVTEAQMPPLLALMTLFRTAGMLCSPPIGAGLYVTGGFPLTFSAVAVVLLIGQCLIFGLRCTVTSLPPRNPRQSDVWQLVRVPMVWAMGALILICMSVVYIFEPIYEQMLSGMPYALDVATIGLLSTLPTLGIVLASLTVASTLHLLVGANAQQGIGFAIIIFAYLILGPSPLLPFVRPGIMQFIIGAVLSGFGFGVGLFMQPIFLLRILWRDAGLVKQQVAGSLAAINMMIASLGTIIFPTVGSALYADVGPQALSTIIAAALLVVYVPVAILLVPYAETPECFKPRPPRERRPEPAGEEYVGVDVVSAGLS